MEKEHMEKKSEDHPKQQSEKQEEKVGGEEKRKSDLWNSVTCIPVLYKINEENTSVTLKRIKFYA